MESPLSGIERVLLLMSSEHLAHKSKQAGTIVDLDHGAPGQGPGLPTQHLGVNRVKPSGAKDKADASHSARTSTQGEASHACIACPMSVPAGLQQSTARRDATCHCLSHGLSCSQAYMCSVATPGPAYVQLPACL